MSLHAAADALRGRLAHFESAAGHCPEAIVSALDQQDAAVVVEDGRVTARVGCQVIEVLMVDPLELRGFPYVLQGENFRRDAENAPRAALGVRIVSTEPQFPVGDGAQLVRPEIEVLPYLTRYPRSSLLKIHPTTVPARISS